MKRFLLLIFAALALSLSGCVTIPPELVYQQPELPLGSSTIKGSRSKGKWDWFVGYDVVNVFGVDEKFVNGYTGVSWNKETRLSAGPHAITVNFSSGTEYVGSGTIEFVAEASRDYIIKYQFPVVVPETEKAEEAEPLGAESEEADTALAVVEENTIKLPTVDNGGSEQATEKSKDDQPNKVFDGLTAWVWIEELSSGKIASQRLLIPVRYVPTVYIPIFI